MVMMWLARSMLILWIKRRQRGRLTGTGRTGHQHQTARIIGKLVDDRRQAKLFDGQNFVRNKTQRGGQVAAFVKSVDTEAAQITEGETEVEFFIFEQNLLLVFVQNGKNQALRQLLRSGHRRQ